MPWKRPSDKYRAIPLELDEANSLVARWHRHHKPVHRCISLGLIEVATGRLVAAAMLGRPVSRMLNHHEVLEVVRLVSDGTENACSMLLGAAARLAKDWGFRRIQTYTLEGESGASLRGAGWIREHLTTGGHWNREDAGGPRRRDQPEGRKVRWARELNPPLPGPREASLAAWT